MTPRVIVPDGALLSRGDFEAWCTGHHASQPPWRGSGQEPSKSLLLFGEWWMRLMEEDDSVCPNLARDGFWESWVSLAFARAVRPGALVVDAGAHVGWFTLLALARGAAKVFAVEPQPRPFVSLLETARDNGLTDRLDFTGTFAVGSTWGAADLLLYGPLTGSASFLNAPGYTPTGSIRVPVAPLDGLLDFFPWNEPGAVDLVKLDVEGAEADAWEGMQGLLARNPRAAVVMEVGVGRGYDLIAFLGKMHAGGFRVCKVDYAGDVVEPPVDRGLLDKDAAGEWATLWIDRPEAERKAAEAA